MSSPAPNGQHEIRQRERSDRLSAPQSHPRESSRSRESVRSGKSVRSGESVRSGGSSRSRESVQSRESVCSVGAQPQTNLQKKAATMGMADVIRRQINTRAALRTQGEAPGYSDPIPQHPSSFQRRPAQQEHFNEGRRGGQSISPQLVATAADSRPLRQQLNLPIQGVYENRRRGSPSPPPLLRFSFSGSESQLTKDNDLTRSQRHTDNVTGQRGWRREDSSGRSSSRPRFPRPQPGRGSETLSPLEVPNLSHETTTSPRIRHSTTEQVQQIPIERIRPARERNLNRDSHSGPDFPPDPRCGNQIPAGLSPRVVAGDQNQASSSKSSVSNIHASDLRGGLGPRESSQSPPHCRNGRNRSSGGGKNPRTQLCYVRRRQSSLFTDSKMDGKSKKKGKTDSGEKILGGVWVCESGVTQQGTKNSKAWGHSRELLGFSWAPGEKFLTRKNPRKVDDQDREKLQNHRSRRSKDR